MKTEKSLPPKRASRLRARASGRRLTEPDTALVKAMLARGDRQHDIAGVFGVNGGRISEIATGKRFDWVRPATEAELADFEASRAQRH